MRLKVSGFWRLGSEVHEWLSDLMQEKEFADLTPQEK
jgi:hypothetical protein